MPLYDYECPACGDFTEFRSMAESAAPHDCPDCGTSAPRVIRTAPAFGALPASVHRAHAINERSADRPSLTSDGGHRHGPNCGCGGANGKGRQVLRGKDGSKAFPTARPWMISH